MCGLFKTKRYLCAVGVAQNAGDGDAFLHRRQNINKAVSFQFIF